MITTVAPLFITELELPSKANWPLISMSPVALKELATTSPSVINFELVRTLITPSSPIAFKAVPFAIVNVEPAVSSSVS